MDARILDLLVDEGTRWVLGQCEAHRSRGLPLDGLSREKVAPFFDRATLDGVRVRTVILIESPNVYERIPLEAQAFALERRFVAAETPFPVDNSCYV